MENGPTTVSVLSLVVEELRLEPAQNHNMVENLAQERLKPHAMDVFAVSIFLSPDPAHYKRPHTVLLFCLHQ